MKKILLLGDEALAQGAIDAGISGFYGYPGTPSTEIIEYVQKNKVAIDKNIHRTWSSNEKTAMEEAVGMSYAGKRTMATMKHVGLNVAADPFMNSAMTGANGGLLVAVADDPSMHSSQNEQDSRIFANFALIPCLEPSDQQECYDAAKHGFELSEKFKLPVMVRLVTRLSHSRSGVAQKEMIQENSMATPEDPNQFMLLPAFSRRKYDKLVPLQAQLEKASEESPFNKYIDGSDKSLGIIACGLGYNYLMENVNKNNLKNPILKVSQYPLPRKFVEKMMNECDQVLVIEDGMPVVEQQLKGYVTGNTKVKGRLDGSLPRVGELNPNHIAKALNLPDVHGEAIPEVVAGRPPALCVGCPHADSFKALKEAIKDQPTARTFGDIGCYTLGFMAPYKAIDTTLDMGASITMAKGASEAGLHPAIAVIGDSTFFHSGMTGLMDCVYDKANLVIVILDNSTTGMTGGQEYTGVGRIEAVCKALGVEEKHIRIITPLPKQHEENVQVFKEEIAYEGVSVIIPRRECVQTLKKKLKSRR